eukprot:5966991-Amphidinium_carterae.2
MEMSRANRNLIPPLSPSVGTKSGKFGDGCKEATPASYYSLSASKVNMQAFVEPATPGFASVLAYLDEVVPDMPHSSTADFDVLALSPDSPRVPWQTMSDFLKIINQQTLKS